MYSEVLQWVYNYINKIQRIEKIETSANKAKLFQPSIQRCIHNQMKHFKAKLM